MRPGMDPGISILKADDHITTMVLGLLGVFLVCFFFSFGKLYDYIYMYINVKYEKLNNLTIAKESTKNPNL